MCFGYDLAMAGSIGISLIAGGWSRGEKSALGHDVIPIRRWPDKAKPQGEVRAVELCFRWAQKGRQGQRLVELRCLPLAPVGR